jgi:hypothetical protein
MRGVIFTVREDGIRVQACKSVEDYLKAESTITGARFMEIIPAGVSSYEVQKAIDQGLAKACDLFVAGMNNTIYEQLNER